MISIKTKEKSSLSHFIYLYYTFQMYVEEYASEYMCLIYENPQTL